jgi:hypothetical protein
MGADTTIYAFDSSRFEDLSLGIDEVRSKNDSQRLAGLIASDPGLEEEFGERFRRLVVAGNIAARLGGGETEVADFLARLFFQYCRPAFLSLTCSSFVPYLYRRSPYLERLFTVESFHGSSMEIFLGPGAVRLDPEIARTMWKEILDNLPSDMSVFYAPEVSELQTLDSKIDKKSYGNICIGYL